MSRPSLLKRTSSIAIRIDQERGSHQDAALQEIKAAVNSQNDKEERVAAMPRPDLEEEGEKVGVVDKQDEKQDGDTDVMSSSDGDTVEMEVEDNEVSETTPTQRISKRIISMKRRGKMQLTRVKSEKFLYFANDCLAVRAEGKEFYLCRTLEDVPESKESFNVAWFDVVDEKEHIYKVSYDDVCYQSSVIERVKITELPDGTFQLGPKYLRQVRRLLREALKNEAGLALSEESSGDEEEVTSTANEEDDGAPPKKKRRKLDKGEKKERKPREKKERKPREKKEKQKKEPKPAKRRGLVPNPNIKLVDKDPLFEEKNDMPVTQVKRGIQAVLLNDMEMLKNAINDIDNVYTVFWNRSADVKLGPVQYALLNGNIEALKLLKPDDHPKERKAKRPNVTLSQMNTGTYNFFTFGHAVRDLEASRGSKEGNNAFLKEVDAGGCYDVGVKFCLKRNISPDIIRHCYPSHDDLDTILDEIFQAVKHGNRKLAAHFMVEADKHDRMSSYGFNFLHKEVLVNETEPLTKFKVQSVTKKPYGNMTILPLHCAAINPNPKYLQALLASVPDYLVKDTIGRKLVHYAAACEGPGPLKLLISRGVDPNDVDNKGTTPLMIAAKLGRDENVAELLSITITEEEISDEEDDQDDDNDAGLEKEQEKAKIEVKRVNANFKHRKTAKAALHYAAKNGHESTVRLLVENGAKVDLQTGAGSGNATALVLAAEQGHLEVVKALVELGAAPDIKVRQRKTPLMIAAQNGHYKVMAYLLNIGVNPDAQDTSLNTPIHYASAYGWYHCLKLLLGAGADPNVANNWKTTPLAIALLKDNLHCADLLLSRDIDVDFPDDKGATVLMRQLLSPLDEGNLEKVKFLVEKKGAGANKKDMKECTPLHYLASNSVFVDHGYSRGIRSPRKRVRFDKKCSDICNEIASILIKAGADVNAAAGEEDGHTPLKAALLQHNFPLIKLLLENGANPNNVEKGSPETALHSLLARTEVLDLIEHFDDTSSSGDLDELDAEAMNKIYTRHDEAIKWQFFKLLFDHGADVNACSTEGKTVLMMTIEHQNDLKMSEILLSHGADPKYGKNLIGQNTLHLMALNSPDCDWSKQLEVMQKKFKLEKSEHITEHVDNDGYTPLLIACEALATCGSDKDKLEHGKSFIKVLVEKCNACIETVVAQKTISEEENESERHRSLPGLGLSIEKDKEVEDDQYGITGRFTCLHFLAFVPYQADDDSSLIRMITNRMKGNSESHRKDQGFHARCRHGRTALHQAITARNSSSAAQLIKYGFDVDALSENKEEDGLQNPLSMASKPPYQFEIVWDLLKAGADTNLKDGKEGRTALSYAVENVIGNSTSARNPLDLVKALIDAGADIKASDNNERTPLHYIVNASSGGYEALTEVEELLLQHGANPCAIDATGRMPIFYAFCKIGKEEETSMIDPISIVSLLCECDYVKEKQLWDAMLTQADCLGRRVIHFAALRGASISCLHLAKYSPLCRVEDQDGNTPLTLALRSGHSGCAMLLLQQEKELAVGDVVTPVTKESLKKFEKEFEEKKWKFNIKNILKKPKELRKPAFQLTIENDWHGNAYLMLATDCIPFIEAFRASLNANKLQLTWTLLKQQRRPEAFLEVDEKKSNLMHVLAAHADKDMSHGGLLMQIANYLTEKGVDVSAVDVDGISALHLAAHHAHQGLCEFLLSKDDSLIDIVNKDGMTPLAAAFGAAIQAGYFSRNQINLIKYLVQKGVKTLDVCYYTGTLNNEDKPESTTILNDLILLENKGNFSDDLSKEGMGCVEFLLANGADVNFANHDGSNPMMTAILLNYTAMVELLLKSKKLNLRAKTKDGGKSFMHLCVGPCGDFTNENTEIFQLLKKRRVSMEEVDNDGHTPLYYALRQPSGIMADLFPARLKKDIDPSIKLEEVFSFNSTIDEYWKNGEINVEEDAKKELQALNDISMEDPRPAVDSALNMTDNGVVCFDDENEIFFDVVLTKVDVRFRAYGLNVFYKLQVVHHKGKQLWILFNRWGRIGGGGQHQQTPFNSPKEAYDEFKKIFKSKTGNKWGDLETFEKMPGKYALVKNEKNPERMLHRKEEILQPYNPDQCAESNMPEELRKFVHGITSMDIFTGWLQRWENLDQSLMPFGLISWDVIEEAKGLLQEVRDKWKEQEKILENWKQPQSSADQAKFYEQIAELSNKFFMMIPPANYAFERIQPLNETYIVDDYVRKLGELTQLSVASEMLLAAQHNKAEVNPLDYCYRGLGIHCELMDPSSEESQYILEYLEQSCRSGEVPMIAGIYRINRPAEKNNFEECGIKHNRQMLWHGTHTAHMISILKHGLKMDARNARITGSSLGNGVYFSLEFSKSLAYSSHDYGSFPGFVFLCEVALGDIKEYNPCEVRNVETDDEQESGYNTRWLISQNIPNPDCDITTPFGAKLRRGNWITNPAADNERCYYYGDHECVVRDPKQIKIRYLVQTKHDEDDPDSDDPDGASYCFRAPRRSRGSRTRQRRKRIIR